MAPAKITVEQEGPSARYAAWVERRFSSFVLQEQDKQRVNVEARSGAVVETDPMKTVQIFQESTKEAHRCAILKLDLKYHQLCVEAARRGWLCSEELRRTGPKSADSFSWIFGKPALVQKQIPVGEQATLAQQDVLEIWYEDDPTIHYREFYPGPGKHYEALSKSIAQDQVRAWMSVVRRRFQEQSQILHPHLPSELFLKIRFFLRPCGSVILNPLYLAETAAKKRLRDIEPLAAAALKNCLEDAPRAAVHAPVLKHGATGKVWSRRDPVRRTTVVGLQLGTGLSFMIEGRALQMWPLSSENEIIDSEAWETLRQTEIADKAPLVRPSKEEVKYANLMGILREFFESKGLKFTQNEEDRSKFEISWG
ncbi:unnamed protein product [Amoebophrya sp. A120]|nr:unnamed protein product [Amoebophrya sp. A120]|eukprot:GSA120T00012995001.1